MNLRDWRLWAIGLLLAGLVASAAASVYLMRASLHYYRHYTGTLLDPLGLEAYPMESNPPANPGRLRVVFFGDSRAAWWPVPHDDPRYEFINRGIGGQTAVQVAQRYNAHIAPLNPDMLVIQVGINDITIIPLFPQQRAAIIANTQTSISQVVDQARAAGIRVILTTVFPVGPYPLLRAPFWSDDIPAGLAQVNAYIRGLAAPDVIVLDAYTLLAGGDGFIQPQYADDELHLSPAGYAALNAELLPLLAQILAGAG